MANTIETGVTLNFNLFERGLQEAARYTQNIATDIEQAYRHARNLANLEFPKNFNKQDIKAYYRTLNDTVNLWKRISNEIDRFITKQKNVIAVAESLGKVGLANELKQAVAEASNLKQELDSAFKAGRQPDLKLVKEELASIATRADIVNKKYAEQQRIIDRLKNTESELLRKREQLANQRLQPTGISQKQLQILDSYINEIRKAKAEISSLSLTSDNFGKKSQQAIELATNALKNYQASLRAARQAQLDLIRGKELSAISRVMATYPYSAHEIAKPAEQITTSFFVAGPTETIKQWWGAAKQVAAQEGRAAAAVFTGSVGQYMKQNFARAFGAWLGAAMTTFPIFYGIGRFVGEINRQYNELVEVSRYVQSATVSVNGTFEDLKTIMNDIIKLSIKTGESFQNVGKALWEMRSAGFGANEAIAGTEIAIKLAMLSGETANLGETTRIVAGLYRLFKDQFKDTADEAERFKNMFGKVVYTLNISQISLKELLKAFEYFGSTAKISGMSLEQMLAYLSVLSDQRLPGVGRAARQAANQIAQAIPMLAAKYGIVLDVAQPLAKQLDVVFSELNKRIKEGVISTQEFAVWMKEAGIRGGPAVLALAANYDKVRERFKLLYNDMDEFFDVISDVRMDYFTKQWERLKNAILGVSSGGIHPLKQSMAEFFKVAADGFDMLWGKIAKIRPELVTLNTALGAIIGGAFGRPFIGAAAGSGVGVLLSQAASNIDERFERELYGKSWNDLRSSVASYFDNIILTFRDAFKARENELAEFDDLFEETIFDESKIKELAATWSNKLNSALQLYFKENGLDIPKEVIDQIKFTQDDIIKIVKSTNGDFNLLGTALKVNFEERLQKVARSLGISTDKLSEYGKTSKEVAQIITKFNNSLADLEIKIKASSGAAIGHITAIDKLNSQYKAFANSLRGFSDRYIKIQELLSKYPDISKAPKDVQEMFSGLAHDAQAYMGSVRDSFSDIAKANATFVRIISQAQTKITQLHKKQGDSVSALIKEYSDLETQLNRLNAITGTSSPLFKLLEYVKTEYQNTKAPFLKTVVDWLTAILENAQKAKQAIEELQNALISGTFDKELRNIFEDVFKISESGLKEFDFGKNALYKQLFGEDYKQSTLQQLRELRDSLAKNRDELIAKGAPVKDIDESINKLNILIAKREEIISIEENYKAAMEESTQIINQQADSQEKLSEKARIFKNISDDIYRKQLDMLPAWKRGIADINRQYMAAIGELNQFEAEFPDMHDWVEEQKKALDDWYNYMVSGGYNIQRIWDNMFSNIEGVFVDFLTDFKFNMDSITAIFRRAAAEMVVEWITSWIKMKMISAGANLLGSIFGGIGGLFGGATASTATTGSLSTSWDTFNMSLGSFTFHKGGIVGLTPAPVRLVPSSLFENAQRLHSGLAPDEFPAILQRGEIVLPKDTKIRNEEQQAPVIIINAIDVKTFEDYVKRNPGAIITIVNDALKRNTALTQTVRSL